jgi:CBS domain-containing protein
MKTSVIRQRVADFLKGHAPFEALSDKDILDLAGSGRVRFHEAGEFLFRKGQAKGQFIWMVQQGRVEMFDDGPSGTTELRDVVGEGDLLGLEQFVGDGSYLFSARTASDVIIYALSAELFESLVRQNTTLQRFLSAQFSVGGLLGFGRTSWLDAALPSVEFWRARTLALPCETPVEEGLIRLLDTDTEIAALVDDGSRPLGILSLRDVCGSRASSLADLSRPCGVMASDSLSVRSVVRKMLAQKTEELALTRGGSAAEPLEGILTASDVAMFCGENPMRLLRAIRRANTTGELGPLREQANRLALRALARPDDVVDSCQIASEAGKALVEACIRIASRELRSAGFTAPAVPYSWMIFGASARCDVLEPEMPTLAAVYDDGHPSFGPDDSVYFAAVVGETMALLHACGMHTREGFFWPEGSQASMPLSEWKRLYSETIRNPIGHDLYARREFFDLEPLSADPDTISAELRDHIASDLREHKTMLPLLANDTLANLPPLTFFHGLVLELDGQQKDSFNIESAALRPIAAAARVFAIAKSHLDHAGTLSRLQAAADEFPESSATFREAAEAFKIAVYYRALAGVPDIHPGTMDKFDQRLLKTAFLAIQSLLHLTECTFVPE